MNERHVLWTDQIHRGLKVLPNIRIGILIERQRSGSVLDEDLQEADRYLADRGDRVANFRRDQMKSALSSWEDNLFLEPF